MSNFWDHPTDDRRVWLGDVGFRTPSGQLDEGAWWTKLCEARWRGMHPDLVPFAEDGFGNRFCFVHSERESMRGVHAIVYWMYETYRAVPIASDFDGFLYWTALTAWTSVRRGDPVVDEDHLEDEVLPALEAVGLRTDVESGVETSDPDPVAVHHALLRLDPDAPGARVALAKWMAEHDRPLEALDLCAEACFTFPEFAGARAMAAQILTDEGGSRYFEALLQTLKLPLLYGGDEAMPFLRDLPPLDPNWAAERLAMCEEGADLLLDDPLAGLILREDPMACHSWVQLALDYASEDRLDEAATAASNALFLGFNTDLGPEIHGLLEEIYRALGWEWHAAMVGRWRGE